jgi:uncharacterized protein (TIGR00369 family)
VADDLLTSVRERARGNRFWQHLGIEVEAAGEGWVKLRVPVRDDLRNAAGAPVHGGVLATLVDAAIGGALGTYGVAAAGGTDQATLDLNVSFVGAARGRTIAFGETRVTDAAGALVAVGRATYMLIAPRPTSSPSPPCGDGVEHVPQRPMPSRNSSTMSPSGMPSSQSRM